MSRDYLKAWGGRWYTSAPINLRYLHKLFYTDSRFLQSKDIIVLSGILPHRENVDAGEFKEEVLDTFDGKKVNSLEALKALFESPSSKAWIKMRFVHKNQPLILSKAKLGAVHEKVLNKYKVTPAFWLGSQDDDGSIGVDD